MNQVNLIGRLGQDPDVRTTQSGTQVCRLRLATSERRKDKEGNWAEHAEWHSVVLWGRDAENAGKFLRKGSQVAITGRLSTTKYQGKDGQERYTTEVVCERMEFVGGRKEGGGQPERREPEPQRDMSTHGDPPPFDDELPF